MANLTLMIDDGLLMRARRRALENGTSVNALVRDYLESFAGANEASEARQELLELARDASGSSGAKGRIWQRDDAHER